MLAYGVVFVLLIGEIDLSIGYVAGVGASSSADDDRRFLPGGPRLARDLDRRRRLCRDRRLPGIDRGLIGVPAFVVTLAGYQIWQGVIQKVSSARA